MAPVLLFIFSREYFFGGIINGVLNVLCEDLHHISSLRVHYGQVANNERERILLHHMTNSKSTRQMCTGFEEIFILVGYIEIW